MANVKRVDGEEPLVGCEWFVFLWEKINFERQKAGEILVEFLKMKD